MVKYHLLWHEAKTSKTDPYFPPSSYLNVDVSAENESILKTASNTYPGYLGWIKYMLLSNRLHSNHEQKIAKRTLDTIGNINLHCRIVNSVDEMKKLKNKYEIILSLEHIQDE